MATAKKETTELNVYQKLQAVREEFYEAGAKKTGKNLHAEFMYYELKDIVPLARPLFTKYGLFMYATFKDGIASAFIVNTDDTTQRIVFDIPMLLLSEPAKFRMNEIQGMGSAVTYYRRYLYMLVLDLVDSDNLDNQDGKKNLLTANDEKPKAENTKPEKPKVEGHQSKYYRERQGHRGRCCFSQGCTEDPHEHRPGTGRLRTRSRCQNQRIQRSDSRSVRFAH